MKKFVNGKLAAVLLAVALTLAVSPAAFAVWPSFQEDFTNNAVITAGAPTSTSTTATAIQLGTSGTTYAGVDTTSVINGNTAYTLYDGGAVNGTNGGARLAVTNLSSKTSANYQIDPLADNVQQLSTPFLNTANNTLYAAATYYEDRLNLGSINFSTGTTTLTYTINVPSDYYEPQLAFTFPNFIAAGNFSATATLSGSGGTFSFGPGYFSGTSGGNSYTAYKNGSSLVPDGSYTLTVTVTNNTGSTITGATMKFLVSRWRLWSVDVSVTPPVPTLKQTGYGQANTPIEYTSGQASFYFGIYEGDRSYYKYTISGDTLTRFNAQDDFYWAGAIAVSGNVIFGSDSGKLYVRDAANFGTSGSVIDLATYKADAGEIRSTIVDGDYGYIYFTSSGTGDRGYLWAVQLSTITSASPNVLSREILPASGNGMSSVSTPVVSPYDYLYVGSNEYDQQSFRGEGQVIAFDLLSGPIPSITYTAVYTGDPVSASPIVYTSGDYDYVYFTTNSGSGAGYCYRYMGTTSLLRWTFANTSGNKYSLQGMASDGGKVVWGDDGNKLYIAP